MIQKLDSMKFNNIRLLVSNFDKCYHFYKNILGLECSFGAIGESYAHFKTGVETGLALFNADLMAQAVKNNYSFYKKEGIDNFALIFEVANLEDTVQKLVAQDVELVNPPSDMIDWGIRIAHFRDPDGNLLEIYSNL